MSSLTYIEKQRLEELFGMRSGYVLDFSNRTFDEFFRETFGIEIYDSKYDYGSGSKANRLRAFWNQEGDQLVSGVLDQLIEIAEYEESPELKQLEYAKKVVQRLRGTGSFAPLKSSANDRRPAEKRAVAGSRAYDVALSFAGEQRPYVAQVAATLQENNVRVFYDEFEDLWGKDLAVELEQIYGSESRFVVIFVSVAYLSKAWPNHERQHALAGRIQRQDDSILPVHFDDSFLPGLPSSVSYLKVDSTTPEGIATRILDKLRRSH